MCVLLWCQYGPFSERVEVTTGPGAPEPCRPPHIICKSPSCAVVSWEVRITYFIFHYTGNEFTIWNSWYTLLKRSQKLCYCFFLFVFFILRICLWIWPLKHHLSFRLHPVMVQQWLSFVWSGGQQRGACRWSTAELQWAMSWKVCCLPPTISAECRRVLEIESTMIFSSILLEGSNN